MKDKRCGPKNGEFVKNKTGVLGSTFVYLLIRRKWNFESQILCHICHDFFYLEKKCLLGLTRKNWPMTLFFSVLSCFWGVEKNITNITWYSWFQLWHISQGLLVILVCTPCISHRYLWQFDICQTTVWCLPDDWLTTKLN